MDSLTQTNGGRTAVGWHVDRSTFRDQTHSGVYVDVRRADSAAIAFDVRNCTFSDLGDHGAVLTTSSTSYVGNVMAELLDCTFTDLGDHAYYLRPGRPGAVGDDQRVKVSRVKAHNTTGLYIDLDAVIYRLAKQQFERPAAIRDHTCRVKRVACRSNVGH